MIKITNLTKIFKGRKKSKCVAVNDVTVDLPDTGFVFVVGKSGSGKTTLLSLIGGLDKFNSGEINVNGINLSTLKGRKFDYYRNETIGFIFQDFQLFDYLTVYENIKLGLDFKNDKDTEKIAEALKAVDLEGFEKRYPKELSGGEKQRVAIARVLVKNPSVILADEPTGNLDPDTTNKVLKILQNISKERLVLIVSHNILDAHDFADYILELHEGKLIGTYKRNSNNIKSIELTDGVLRLPLHKELIESEKDEIIKNIKLGVKKIVQDDCDFSPIELKNLANPTPNVINRKHITFFSAFKRGLHFIKNSFGTMLIFSFITATLFSLVNASQTIKDIDYQKTIDYDIDNFDGEYAFLINWKDTKNKRFMRYRINPENLEKIEESNYKGKIYKVYNAKITESDPFLEISRTAPSRIVVSDEDFLTSRFNKIEYIAKSNEIKDFGLYITDFFVDFLNTTNKANSKDYESYLGYYGLNPLHNYINGIIKTDYKTKYSKFLPYIFDVKYLSEGLTKKLISVDKELYKEFVIDRNYYYNNFFTLNLNFEEDLFNSNLQLYRDVYVDLYHNEKKFRSDFHTIIKRSSNPTTMSANVYNLLTGKNIVCKYDEAKKVDPITFTINVYTRETKKGEIVSTPYELTFDRVTRPNSGQGDYLTININNSNHSYDDLIKDVYLSMSGLILDNTANMKLMRENGCFDQMVLFDSVCLSAELADRLGYVFDKIFTVIILGIIACCIISLTFYGIYLVKKNQRMIGICKSLGARTIDMLVILALNLIVTIGLTLLLYSGLAFAFIGIFELIIKEAFVKASIYQISISYKLLFTNFGMYFGLMAMIAFFSIVSFIALFIKINKLKPLELIKSNK